MLVRISQGVLVTPSSVLIYSYLRISSIRNCSQFSSSISCLTQVNPTLVCRKYFPYIIGIDYCNISIIFCIRHTDIKDTMEKDN